MKAVVVGGTGSVGKVVSGTMRMLQCTNAGPDKSVWQAWNL